jgi:hypothetical protein
MMVNKDLIPYDYRALIVWGVIASFLFALSEKILSYSLIIGILFIVFSISLGLFIDYKLTKKQNLLMKIKNFTSMQILIFKITISIFVFLSIFSILSLKINEYSFVYILWIFTIGLFSLILSFLTNTKIYEIHSKILIFTSILLLLLSIFLGSSLISLLSQILCIIEIGLGYILIGTLKNIESKTQS